VFDLGAVYPAALDVYNAAGVLTDPASATLTITLPDGSTVTPTVPLPSTVPGQLRVSYTTTMPGRHLVRWQTINPNTPYTDVFDVAEQSPPSILSLAMAKRALGIDASNSDDDEELREMLFGITRSVENYKNEVIARRVITGESKQFDQWSWSWQTPRPALNATPVISLDTLVSQDGTVDWLSDGGSLPADTSGRNLYVESQTGLVTVIRGAAITGWVVAGYTAGYRVIPYNYLEGSKVMLQWLWETRRGPGGLNAVIGPEELHAMSGAHPYLIPRKAMEWFGPPFPAVA
jgi:hypothetical protein